MKIKLCILIPVFYCCSCSSEEAPKEIKTQLTTTQIDSPPKKIEEILLPSGFVRDSVANNSFAAWLRKLPLKKDKTVYLFNGKQKPNQLAQYAVVDISTGKKDLQQCADVIMRLRAEYLFSEKRGEEIAFMDYENNWYKWTSNYDRQKFDKYLEKVFGWCGSASLEKQLQLVKNYTEIKIGDVLIKGGFPGHAVQVTDMATNDKGEKIYLLLQGYQPAQDVHVLINPSDATLSPWYKVNDDFKIITPEWSFDQRQLRKWE